ncbi:MAG: methyltransferase [Fusobacteriaceae bacterium]|nr:methyltransferase [Fusobacteriaceae bacterium]MBU9918618.1 methyltransferase [Fusobacteriaceae bacterium]
MIIEDETLEDLPSVNCKIIQKKKGFRFTVDSILLVNFLKLKKNTNLLDIGTGTGIMPLLLCRKEEINLITAVEIETEIAKMFEKTIEINSLESKIKLINIDIKNYKEKPFNMIISNPPYMKLNEGYVSPHDYRAGARHEVNLDLKELLINGKRLLKNGGSFNLVYRTNRFMEVLDEARMLNLNAKRVRFIYSKPNQSSDLFMIEMIKGFKCACVVEEPLYIYNEHGEYTEELKKYYGI